MQGADPSWRPAPRGRRIAPLFLILATTLSCATGPAGEPDHEPEITPAVVALTVQPGAPGESSRQLAAGDLSTVGEIAYAPADVRFMQGMIPHHAQALDMTALVSDRTDDPGFRRLALRMDISQRDEIGLMSRWLEVRGESVSHDTMHGQHGRPMMPGMLTAEQMQQLTAASGAEFERLFLELMIQHHQGAIQMVAELFASPGGGQESEVFQFATDVDADQRMEIDRMRLMLNARLSGDTRRPSTD